MSSGKTGLYHFMGKGQRALAVSRSDNLLWFMLERFNVRPNLALDVSSYKF